MKSIIQFLICYVMMIVPSMAQFDQPNIVLIVADDLGINDLGCYGREDHKTPNLDALAARGIRYECAYCSLPICSASRAGLLTGINPARLHLTSFLPGRPDAPSQKLLNAVMHSGLQPDEETLAEALKKNGYQTGMFGKWHLGSGPSAAKNQGFDVTFEPPGQGDLDEATGAKNEFAITRKAIEFIHQAGASSDAKPDLDKPFFCYVPHHSPHVALKASDESLAEFSNAFCPLYAANVNSLDKAVGMIIDAVDALPTERATIIIFTSDNGGLHVPEVHDFPLTHNKPFRAGKGYLYEGGLRVPMIVASTKAFTISNEVIEEPISHLDVFPTLLQMASITEPRSFEACDGVSLMRQWRIKAPHDTNRTFVWHFPHYTNQGSRPASAIRIGPHKMIRNWEDYSKEYFKITNDREEVVSGEPKLERVDTRLTGEFLLRNPNLNISSELLSQMLYIDLAKELDSELTRMGAQRNLVNKEFDQSKHDAIYVDFDSSTLAVDQPLEQFMNLWRPWRKLMDDATKGKQPKLQDPNNQIRLAPADATLDKDYVIIDSRFDFDVISGWSPAGETATWKVTIPKEGLYDIAVEYACNFYTIFPGDTSLRQVELAVVAGKRLRSKDLIGTGSRSKFIYDSIGNVRLNAGENVVTLRVTTSSRSFVTPDSCSVRRVTLSPIAE
jgi:arylsulfatase A